VENSGYLSNLLLGDVVLADRGFNVAESMAHYGASLYIPAFTCGVDQLDPTQVEATWKIANVRIHVERVIGSMRQRFQILNVCDVASDLYCWMTSCSCCQAHSVAGTLKEKLQDNKLP
jgi:hypothetical protein